MVIFMLFGIIIAGTGISSVLTKKFQLGINNNLSTMIMYNLINAFFGTLCFFILCRFRIEINWVTFLFSVIYALMVINSLAMGVISLSKVSIPFNSIIGMSGNIIGSTFFGAALFGELITLKQIAAMLLLIGAVSVTALTSPDIKSKNNSILVCIWNFMTCFLSSPFLKIYTVTPGVLGINNMFFMTNFIVVVFAAVYIAGFIIIKGKVISQASFACILKRTAVINIASRTVISNICSVASVIVLSVMDLTLFTVLSSSLVLVLNGCISKFMFKESLDLQNYISIILAIAAIIVRTI